ncbi:MAG: FAD-dependent oxidoreductase, partial [Rubripirellula sp.]
SNSREVKVVTDRGVEKAAKLVIAGGPWTRSLIPALSSKLQILRKHLYWFRPSRNGFREQDGFPCFFHETANGFFYGFPCFNGTGVKIARHSGGQPIEAPDTDTANSPVLDESDQQLVVDYASNYLPGLGSQVISTASCYYTSTPDENFVIDQLPDHPNVTVVAGLSGHGFKFTSALGEVASQLALNQTMPFDLAPFAIKRLE